MLIVDAQVHLWSSGTPLPPHRPTSVFTKEFGPERLFWGTDITRMPCTWRQCVTHVSEELRWLTERDKELIMGRALCAWLGWEL